MVLQMHQRINLIYFTNFIHSNSHHQKISLRRDECGNSPINFSALTSLFSHRWTSSSSSFLCLLASSSSWRNSANSVSSVCSWDLFSSNKAMVSLYSASAASNFAFFGAASCAKLNADLFYLKYTRHQEKRVRNNWKYCHLEMTINYNEVRCIRKTCTQYSLGRIRKYNAQSWWICRRKTLLTSDWATVGYEL